LSSQFGTDTWLTGTFSSGNWKATAADSADIPDSQKTVSSRVSEFDGPVGPVIVLILSWALQ
jgi:hypothetical protein